MRESKRIRDQSLRGGLYKPDDGMSNMNVERMHGRLQDAERLISMTCDMTKEEVSTAVEIIAEVKSFMASWLGIRGEAT